MQASSSYRKRENDIVALFYIITTDSYKYLFVSITIIEITLSREKPIPSESHWYTLENEET